LTARLIARAGFKAYQIGGFALAGARYGYPDLDLTHYGEESAGVRDILAACSLPVLVDCDDGYGDVKNVTRTVQGYEALGASALFLEDQLAPKRCGHLAGKRVIAAEEMVAKVRGAVAGRRRPETFILARTDALESSGVDEALRRGERYLHAGADGVYVEGPHNLEELQRIGRAFRGVPLATSVLEGGGKTPWLAPQEYHRLGFSMLLYPTTVLFRITRAIERALSDLRAGRPMSEGEAVDLRTFEDIVDLAFWTHLDETYQSTR
jgi:2-methylisocitrate lyase-like PEP mutase family enzyme